MRIESTGAQSRADCGIPGWDPSAARDRLLPASLIFLSLLSWCTLCLCGSTPTGAAQQAGQLRAGVGKAEITPRVGTPLGGYGDRKGKPSTGAHDPLFAKALILDDGKSRATIVTTDLIGSNPAITLRVAMKTGTPPERLLLCASHTHSGPGAFG